MSQLSRVVVEVTPFMQNCQIIWSKGSTRAVVVDPGGDVPKIVAALASRDLACEEVWLTHSHLDHCGGVKQLLKKTGARLKGHKKDAQFRGRVEEIGALYGIPSGILENCPEPNHYIDEGDTLQCGTLTFEVLFTPGHAPGHLCFYERTESVLIAGDTLFNGSIGRTDLPGCDHEIFMKSLEDKILTLPDATLVCPGHGPDTTVGQERMTNPFLRM